ncbi:MAG: DUF721 domain-containing protein [Armatimonadota bacterium]|nr:DUF721 domain-containing protein [Armatimonadota bacterium]
MVTPIRDILRRAAPGWGLQPAMRLATARTQWEKCVGPALAAMSLPLAVREGRLEVAVTHPAAAQEIKLRAAAIAEAMNRALSEHVVTAVVPVMRKRLPEIAAPRAAPARDRARPTRVSGRAPRRA